MDLDRYTQEVTITERLGLANKGGISILRLLPHVYAEHAIGDGAGVATVQAGGLTDVGQVFEASRPELRSVAVRLNVSTVPVHAEDFESYVDTAALRVQWVASDLTNSPNVLETGVVGEGAKSMAITVSKNKSQLDTVTDTFGPDDWSAVDAMALLIRQDQPTSENQLRIRIGDGVNSASASVPVNEVDVWEQRVILLSNFVNDGVGSVNLAAVTTIEFEIEADGQNGTIYVDDVRAVGQPGTAEIRLHEVDGENPTALGALLGAQSVTLLNSIDGFYDVDFDLTLTVGDHYALVVRAPDVPTTFAGVLGSTGDYVRGDAFTSDDDGVTLTNLPDTDLFFVTYWLTAGVIGTVEVDFDDSPGNGVMDIVIANRPSGRIRRYLVHGFEALSVPRHVFELEDAVIDADDEVALFMQDDPNSPALEVAITVSLRHEPVNTVG